MSTADFQACFTLGVKANVQLKSSIPIDAKVEINPKGFTLGVKANVQLKSTIPIGAKVEISPKGFTLGVKANVQLKSTIPIDAKVEISPKGFTLGVKANVQLKSTIPIHAKVEINHKGFALGVKANVQLESSIPIDAKVEISHKGFALGVKAEIPKKNFSICPKLLINAELYGLVLALRLEKRIPSNLGSQFATLGTNVPAFINILMSMFQHLLVTWGQTTSPKCSKLAPSFFSPDSQCKVGLLSCTLQADFFVVQFWGKKIIKINSLLK